MNSKVRKHPKFNLGLLNPYKLMFSMELSMEKRMSNFLAAVFMFLYVITAFLCTSFFSPSKQRTSAIK